MKELGASRIVAGRRSERGRVSLLPEPPPEPIWCPVISADDHLVEPETLFVGRLPSRLADAGPLVRHDPDGIPWWDVDGQRREIMMMNGPVGRPFEEWGSAAAKFEDFRPGVVDAKARVKDMDICGVWASLPFPSMVWGFAGSRFAQMGDPELGFACMRAYNDWLLEEWCGSAPDRFIASQLTWLKDVDVAAAEIRANAARGFKAVSFSENPEGQDMPSIHTGYWDPFFAACEETDTVINLHVGSRGGINTGSTDSPAEVTIALFPVSGIITLADWMFSRVPLRFPGLKVALSEGGLSWVPMLLERFRRAYRQAEASTLWGPGDPDPVEIVHRNFFFTSVEDPMGFQHLDLIGEDNVMVEMDYPHGDSTWPGMQALVADQLRGLEVSVVKKICFANASRIYRHPGPPPEMLAGAGLEREVACTP